MDLKKVDKVAGHPNSSAIRICDFNEFLFSELYRVSNFRMRDAYQLHVAAAGLGMTAKHLQGVADRLEIAAVRMERRIKKGR